MIKNLKDRLHYLFIPSEKNNFRAKTLHHDFLTYYLALAFVLVFVMRNFGGNVNRVLGIATDITAVKLNEYTNAQRQNNNLSPVVYNEKLSEAARKKAEDMFEKNYWAHFSPDGRTPWDFILGSGYSYELAGENLAKNFLFSQNVVDAWMQSPSHRENILRPEYTEAGYAVVNGVLNGEQTTLVVQMFGKPSAVIAKIPEPTPTSRTLIPNVVQKASAAEVVKPQTAQISPSAPNKISVYITTSFLIFFTFVIVMDLFVASRLNIVRIHGKSLAHFIFLIAVLFGVLLFITKGAII